MWQQNSGLCAIVERSMGNSSSGCVTTSNRIGGSYALPPGLRRQINVNNPILQQESLRFHSSCHGENVRVSEDGFVARRVESFCKGIAFSNRAVKINEYVLLKLLDISLTWSGVLRFGFTNHEPCSAPASLPKYACPDLTQRPGYWAKALPDKIVEKDAVLFYYVNEGGEVYFGVNGVEKGLFLSGVDTKKPLWALVDVYGNTMAVEFIDPYLQASKTSLRRCEESVDGGPSFVAIEAAEKPKHFNTNLKPFPFHSVHGANVTLSPDRTIASREPSEFALGYVFTEKPLVCNSHFVVRVLENVSEYHGALSFGLTNCDPAKVNSWELPYDCDGLLDRMEYWVVMKDVATTPEPGDEIAFLLTEEGEVKMSKNNQQAVTLLHVDQSQQLWAFFDVYGLTTKIQSLGITSEMMAESLVESDDECKICFENSINCVFYSCGHMCMCYECAEKHLKKPNGRQCPICRAKVQDIIKTYKA